MTSPQHQRSQLADEIKRRIDDDHDVTVVNGAVTSEPCRHNYGYGGPSRPRTDKADDSILKGAGG